MWPKRSLAWGCLLGACIAVVRNDFAVIGGVVRTVTFGTWSLESTLSKTTWTGSNATNREKQDPKDTPETPLVEVQVQQQHQSLQTETLCDSLSQGKSPSHLWRQHSQRIIKATQANITGYFQTTTTSEEDDYPFWIHNLFTLLHTRFLRLGYRNPPRPTAMKQVVTIINHAMQNKTGSRPLNVVIVGGSVTQGRGSCIDTISKGGNPNKSYACNWPFQLQKICDEFFGNGIIRIVNLSVGGTGTSLSTTIVKYKLYSHKFLQDQGPDIIINAYSTNDSLPPWGEANNHTYNHIFHKARRETAQAFIRACQDSYPCSHLPLVVYLDDYIGNQHNLILGENSNGWLAHEMAEWYGAMFISFAGTVRRLVYTNQQETVFSASWPWNGKNSVEVHFGLSSHIAIAWVVAFSFLSAAVDFCGDDYDAQQFENLFPEHFPPIALEMLENFSPPLLNADTSIQNVSDQWLEQRNADLARQAVECSANHTFSEVCAIAFVAGPFGTVRNARDLNYFLAQFSENSRGWIAEESMSDGGWTFKLGYVANEENATTTLYRDSSPAPIRAIQVHFLKSYGPKWQDSKARFTFRGIQSGGITLQKTFDLEGYHESNTSVTYEHSLVLNAEEQELLPVGVRVEMTIQLISGSSFKIVSLVVCNHL